MDLKPFSSSHTIILLSPDTAFHMPDTAFHMPNLQIYILSSSKLWLVLVCRLMWCPLCPSVSCWPPSWAWSPHRSLKQTKPSTSKGKDTLPLRLHIQVRTDSMVRKKLGCIYPLFRSLNLYSRGILACSITWNYIFIFRFGCQTSQSGTGFPGHKYWSWWLTSSTYGAAGERSAAWHPVIGHHQRLVYVILP